MSGSIGDVARLAGVSRTTVSHVISGKRPVSKAVANRVRQAVDALGYVPSRAAQNLSRGTTRAVGLLVPDIANGFFADLAKGAEWALTERGYSMVLCNAGFSFERELFYLEMLKSHAVDGVVYAAGVPTKSSELTGVLAGLPVVAADEELGDTAACTVVSDNAAGGRVVADHLTGLGHERGLVIGVNRWLASAMQRVTGFTDGWRRRTGADPDIAYGSFDEDCGYRTACDHLAKITSGRVTALFAVNDLAALGAMRALAEHGLQVPRDCSVVGFDDIYTARHVRPALTTVRQDAVGLGSAAARALLDVLAGTTVEPRLVLDVALVERDTTAAPPVLASAGAANRSPPRTPSRRQRA
jgi:LacI family transcriptional regulator